MKQITLSDLGCCVEKTNDRLVYERKHDADGEFQLRVRTQLTPADDGRIKTTKQVVYRADQGEDWKPPVERMRRRMSFDNHVSRDMKNAWTMNTSPSRASLKESFFPLERVVTPEYPTSRPTSPGASSSSSRSDLSRLSVMFAPLHLTHSGSSSESVSPPSDDPDMSLFIASPESDRGRKLR